MTWVWANGWCARWRLGAAGDGSQLEVSISVAILPLPCRRRGSPIGSAAGSSYPTDGLRAVMVFDRRPGALSQIQLFDWERLGDDRAQTVHAASAP